MGFKFNPFTGALDQVVDKAQQVKYTPTTPADWTVVPDDVAEALDELAASAGGGGSTVTRDSDVFSGNGSQTVFTLSQTVTDEEYLDVYISGVYQFKSTYSLSGTTLTFSVAPPSGANNIEVVQTVVTGGGGGGGGGGGASNELINTFASPINVYTNPSITVPADADSVAFVRGRSAAGSWVSRTTTNDAHLWNDVAWSPSLNLFVAVSRNSSAMYSADGITWSAGTIAGGDWRTVAWSPTLNLFVACAADNTPSFAYSTDGIAWTSSASVIVSRWQGVSWSPSLGLFVAVAGFGSLRIAYSSNGTTWTGVSAPEANNWRDVTWSPSLGLFVATSVSGTNRIMRSSNGTTWTVSAAPEAVPWQHIAWSPQSAVFVIVASSGTNRIQSSTDGISWTARNSAAEQWLSVIWADSPGYKGFIAVAVSGAVGTSPDGITWTVTGASVAGSEWYGIAFSPSLQRVSIMGNTNAVRAATFDAGVGVASLSNGTVEAQRLVLRNTVPQASADLRPHFARGANLEYAETAGLVSFNRYAEFVWDNVQNKWYVINYSD